MKMESKEHYSVIGDRVTRVDAMGKACGEATFVDDMILPGMQYGATLKSLHAHARILSIDTSKAEELPGVKAVITGKDIFFSEIVPGMEDKLPLEKEKVRFIGDEVAAVAAVDLETAEKALELIDVKYEVLPPVLDPEKAMETNSPKIHDKDSNISVEIHYDFGDVKRGFDEADYTFEDRFRMSHQAHCCMETLGCIAQWGEDGRLTIWATTQRASSYQRQLAKVFGIPYSDVRILNTNVGGSFGSRMRIHTIEPICAYLAKKTGRPVKLVYSRDEEFVSSRTRHPAIIELKTGVKKDGTITVREAKVILDNGAYNDIGPLVLHEVATLLCSYYKVENVRVNGYLVYTNKPYGGAFRGFGNPQAAFAVESQMDIIANKLRIDPAELRLKNATDPGDVTACGWEITSCGLKECIKKATEAIGWKKKRGRANNHGVGIAACIHWGGGLRVIESNVCVATVEVNNDGQVYVFTGEKEVGEGSDTVITQIVAEELGIPLKAVKLMPLDTDVTPSFLFAGSPITFVAGGAAKVAASDAKRQILEAAAEMKAMDADDLDIIDGYIYDRPNEQKLMSVSEATHYSYEIMGNPIIGKGRFNMGPTQYDMETGRGQISATYSFAAQAVEIAADPETGIVEVLEFASAHDCGTAINPTMAEGQIEGGLAQGIGYALTEGLAFDNEGKALNSSFTDYKIPRAKDMPRKISSIVVESKDFRGPFGAKALGEISMVVTAAAIANAIEDAIGVRIKELPITPEKVVEASILAHKS